MIKILYLYPKLMNLYGEYGNIVVLKKHLLDQGLQVLVDEKEIGEEYDLMNYDFVYMGSGTDLRIFYALKDVLKYKQEFINYIKSNKSLLFTGNAMELLGNDIDGKEALGIFDFSSKYGDKRYTGDVIVFNDKIGKVVGFINRSSINTGEDKNALFSYVFKDDNLIDNNFEGFSINNAYATHIIGPILVKNPNFLKVIIDSIIPENFIIKNIEYPFEEKSYCITLGELSKR